MRSLPALLLLLGLALPASAQEWVLASKTGRGFSGEAFEVLVIAPQGEAPPDGLSVRLNSGVTQSLVQLEPLEAGAGNRRRYAGVMPELTGPVSLRLVERDSNEVSLVVARRDAFSSFPSAELELPLSENEPMYFVAGPRGGWNARFQLSFKYRLFDYGTGFGRARPWLAGFYFAYTQTSLWDLASESAAFYDTAYRPSLFWRWQRTDAQTWLDGARVGYEHESNGNKGAFSRSLDTLFVRPEWHFRGTDGRVEFTPRVNFFVDRDENPDIADYRGHVDWRVRWDSGVNWATTAVARWGDGRGSVLLDLSRRLRDLKFGPVSGYLHLQYFNGYGESILDYNARRKAQFRIGVAIVP